MLSAPWAALPVALEPGFALFCANDAPALRARTAQLARRSFLIPYVPSFGPAAAAGTHNETAWAGIRATTDGIRRSVWLVPLHATSTGAIRVPFLPLQNTDSETARNNDFLS
jgi:hypothetical protein